MALNEILEDIAMRIISNSGAARGAAFEALSKVKSGEFDEAEKLLKSADEHAHMAHKAHTELLTLYSKGEVEGSDILLAHAQDHMMCAMLAQEMIVEIIELRKIQTNQ